MTGGRASGEVQAAGFHVSGEDDKRTRVVACADGSVETDDCNGEEFSAC